jgi:hypothetical protein
MRDDDDWGLSPLSGTIGSLYDMDGGRRRRKLPRPEPIGFIHFAKLKPKRKVRRRAGRRGGARSPRKPKLETKTE